jgi:hypothetical protein
MGKVIKSGERKDFFAAGGTTKMFGKGYASPKEPDCSGKDTQGENTGETAKKLFEAASYTDGVKYIEGGDGKMFGPGSAGKKVPGISGKETQVG